MQTTVWPNQAGKLAEFDAAAQPFSRSNAGTRLAAFIHLQLGRSARV